jgi:enoyl-CoA hydratase/carnithine racemase
MAKPTREDGEPVVLLNKADAVATVTLNRPDARNALNQALLGELDRTLRACASDPDVRVIVLTGAGSAFCAGADLKETSGEYDSDFWARHERVSQSMAIHKMIPQLPVPVVAAVNGYALAGGCGLAMSCDLVIASDRAQFGYPEAARGLVAAMVMVSLSRLVHRRVALDLLLSGRRVSAAEALDLHMVNRVVAHDALADEVQEYARAIAANSGSALRMTKYLYHQVSEMDFDRATEFARDFNLLVRQTSDAEAGAKSFGSSGSDGVRG